MTFEQKVVTDYLALKPIFEKESTMWTLLKEIEDGIKNEVVNSPEKAVEAHYDLKAIKRLRDKLEIVQNLYNTYQTNID